MAASATTAVCALLIAALAIATAPADAHRHKRKPSISIVAYNDQHGHIEAADSYSSLCTRNGSANLNGDCSGGFARMSTYVKAFRKKYPDNSVFLHAGDEYTGTIWSYYYNGTEASTFDNLIGVEVATLGNHEFDKGPEVLAKNYLSKVKFPITACNVHAVNKSSPIYGKFTDGPVIKKLRCGTRVGFVGWLTTETRTDSSPGPLVEIADYTYDVQRCINILKKKGVDYIVGIGHAGIGYDSDYGVIANTSGLSLVVGGHSHTFMWPPTHPVYYHKNISNPPVINHYGDQNYIQETPYPKVITDKKGRKVPYFQAYWGTRYMDTIFADFLPGGAVDLKTLRAEPVLMGGKNSSNPVAEDPKVVAVIEKLSGPLDVFRNTIVGYSAVKLTRPDDYSFPTETNLGDLCTDAMVWAWQSKADYATFVKTYGPINVAFMNSGGMRVDVAPGPITLSNVLEVLPFGDYDFIQAILGAQLTALFQSFVGNDEGDFPVYSGMKAVLGPSPTPGVTGPIRSLLIKSDDGTSFVPIVADKTYYIVTTNYIAAGASGFQTLEDVTVLNDFGEPENDDLAAYLTKFYDSAAAPYPGTLDGRLVVATR